MVGGRQPAGRGVQRVDEPGATARLRRLRGTDDGAAIVEFVSIVGLLTLMFLGVLQVALVVHVRNTLVDCASEGARFGGLADRTAADGADRTRLLIRSSLGAGYADEVSATETVTGGVPVVEVRVTAPLPALGLIGVGHELDVTGHGLIEGR